MEKSTAPFAMSSFAVQAFFAVQKSKANTTEKEKNAAPFALSSFAVRLFSLCRSARRTCQELSSSCRAAGNETKDKEVKRGHTNERRPVHIRIAHFSTKANGCGKYSILYSSTYSHRLWRF